MTRFKSLVAMMFVAGCAVASAETYYGSVSLSTPYEMSITGWTTSDGEAIYVPAHASITVTGYDYDTDSSEYIFQQEGSLIFNNYWIDTSLSSDIPETYYNDSEEGVYIYVTLDSWVYQDYYDLIHNPASSASVSYQIDTIEE